ncbi:TIGR04338 family metallohydrolase [Mycolicibacterium alvei]|uniref:TIGR04338 family metallohydrolase n=1 Tax=Mycolicibacterium alvei TaxID=67081 RepID=A0A6N4UX29_9MYCO|nr:TIGR04338 family metallohydrolase [Mycolicibacterium alvei]MCV7001835.1 TIGR04338 family metallohydrolase [Mycolicibacterium alvei]BBX28237.1 hypothetical protein MALV_33620 [Mycolicibacterium alvei]
MSTKDAQRARVYAAEQFVRTMFDRAAQHSSRAVDFFGTSLTLPPEAKFGSVDSVQRYVDDVIARVGADPVAVRRRRGVTAAHYELVNGKAVIAVPERDTWALRELVVLHELAHHVSHADPPHGPAFVVTYCELCSTIMGPEVGLVLRMVYAKEGVL